MSYLKRFYLLLVFACWFSAGWSQQLYLEISATKKENQVVVDSVGYLKKHSNFKSITSTQEQLLQKLQKAGYISVKYSSVKKINDSTYFSKITLGKIYRDIKIYHTSEIDKNSVKKYFRKETDTSFVIKLNMVEKVLQELNSNLAEKGKPFNSLQLENLQSKDSLLTANLTINQTKLRQIDNIIVKGYKKFPKSFLRHYLRIRKKEVFSKEKLSNKLKKLKNLRFATSYKEPEVLFTKDSTNIYLYLEKKESNLFDGFLGFATNPKTNNLELNGYVNLSLVNNLNFGESFSLEYKNDAQERQHFYTNLKLPFIFNSPFGLRFNLELYKQDSTYTTNAQKAAVDYQINPATLAYAGYKAEKSNNLSSNSNLISATQDYNASFLTLGAEYQELNLDNQLMPIQTNLNLQVDVGQRETQGKNTNQVIAFFHGAHIFNLNKRNSIFVGNQTGYLGSDNYLENELFRFGGIKSVRGFEENSLCASFYTSFQTEYRYLLSPNLYAHSILDFAQTENGITNTKNTLYGIGIGLGLQTKAGLLRLNFANGKTESQNFEFRNSKIHLSLTAIF